MTRKRLSDLLRSEEVPSDGNSASEATSKPRRTPAAIRSELEATIARLEQELAAAQQLQDTYREELAQQRRHIEVLEDQLRTANHTGQSLDKLQAQLEQVQQEALQLAQSNSRLLEENQALQSQLTSARALPVPQKRPPASRPVPPPPPAPPPEGDFPVWLL